MRPQRKLAGKMGVYALHGNKLSAGSVFRVAVRIIEQDAQKGIKDMRLDDEYTEVGCNQSVRQTSLGGQGLINIGAIFDHFKLKELIGSLSPQVSLRGYCVLLGKFTFSKQKSSGLIPDDKLDCGGKTSPKNCTKERWKKKV